MHSNAPGERRRRINHQTERRNARSALRGCRLEATGRKVNIISGGIKCLGRGTAPQGADESREVWDKCVISQLCLGKAFVIITHRKEDSATKTTSLQVVVATGGKAIGWQEVKEAGLTVGGGTLLYSNKKDKGKYKEWGKV